MVLSWAVLSLVAAAGAPSTKTIAPCRLTIGERIASGKYGTCHWAQLDGGLKVVAKHASTVFSDEDELEDDRKRAAEYLETEEEINMLLEIRAPIHSTLELHGQTVAPYLGAAVKDGTRYLVWEVAGEATLDDYLRGQHMSELAAALGCDENQLPRRVLHDMLQCLAHLHACGVSHRDLKPSNLLVDSSTHKLRLIDFGSAADCTDWLATRRRGWRAIADRMPCCILFSAAGDLAPKRPFAERAGWYKFDVYAAAVTWLCVVEPALARDKDMLFELRMSLQAHHHDPHKWREACSEGFGDEGPGCTVPATAGFESIFGWTSAKATVDSEQSPSRRGGRQLWGLFGSVRRVWRSAWRSIRRLPLMPEAGSEQEHAWQLLTSLIALDPERRPSAAEALLGSYLSNDGSESYLPVTAPEPWTLEALLSAAAAARVDAVVEAQLRDGSGSAAGVGRVPAPEYLWRQRSLDFI